MHRTDGQSDLRHGVAFVEVKATLHTDHTLTFDCAVNKLANMPLHRGNRKAFNIPVRQAPDYFNAVVGKKAEAGAKNESDLWFKICELLRYFWEYHSVILVHFHYLNGVKAPLSFAPDKEAWSACPTGALIERLTFSMANSIDNERRHYRLFGGKFNCFFKPCFGGF